LIAKPANKDSAIKANGELKLEAEENLQQ